jgi:CheY-like chemotaxis protein
VAGVSNVARAGWGHLGELVSCYTIKRHLATFLANPFAVSAIVACTTPSFWLRRERPVLIFVVDDERMIASTLAAILQASGYDAISFVDPLEALEATRTVKPDLIIADVVMPGLSGIDLAVRLREECPTCKILLLSGQTVTEDLLEAARSRGHDFEVLAKPIHPTDLLARIKETCRNTELLSTFL